jgi:hypothetical protein
MRILFAVALTGLLALARCASETPAQQASTLVCLEDETGVILGVVAGTTDANGKVTGTQVAAGTSTVLMSGIADPNCAAAILAAAQSGAPKPAAPVTPTS